MRVRLSFAVAIHADADIYLLDEIFGGVGDEAFRIKSQRVFEETFLKERTVLFVSHSLANVQHFSHKVLLLDKGKQVFYGAPDEAIDRYHGIVATSG